MKNTVAFRSVGMSFPYAIRRALLGAATLAFVAAAQAANQYWDGTDTTANADGGNGTWDTATTSNWDNAATGGSNQMWADYDYAYFGGTGGAVTIASGGIKSNGLNFTVTGYTLGGGSVTIGNPGAQYIKVSTGCTATINADVTSTYNYTYINDLGTLKLGGANTFYGINLSAGTLDFSGSANSGVSNALIVTGSAGLVKSGAGSLTISGNLHFASITASSLQTLNVSNGTLTVGGNFRTGQGDGSGNLTGKDMTLTQTGGSIVINGNGGNDFALANWGGTTTVNLSGGTLTESTFWGPAMCQRGTTNFTISGTASATFGSGTGKTLTLAGQVGSVGNLYLNGGTLTVNGFGNGSGTGSLYFNGGTLKAGAASASFLTGLSNAKVRNGGAVIDTNTYNITIGQNLLEDSGSTGGGLTKNNTGTLTLTGVSTYTGGTTINNGTLDISGTGQLGSGSYGGAISNSGTLKISSSANQIFSGALSGAGAIQKTGSGTLTLSGGGSYSGALTVNNGILAVNSTLSSVASTALASGTTLKGTGTLGGTTTIATGTAVIGDSASTGTLTLGNLTFSGTGTISVGALANYTTSSAISTGTLTLNGGAGSITLALPSGTLSNGTYHLVGHTNALDDLTAFTVTGPSVGGRQSASLVNNTGMIDYVVSGDSPYWTGANSTAWDTATTNWKLITAGTDTQYIDSPTADSVLFKDSVNVVNTTVDIAADVTPLGVEFNNSTLDFTLTGAKGIIGATGLTKNGTGSLTINNANTYSGGTIIGAGSVVLGNAGALGSGAVSLNGGTLDLNGKTMANAVVLGGGVLAGNGGTIQGAISETGGAQALTVGSNLTLTGVNTYTGATTINAGTLEIGGAGQLNSGAYAGAISNAGALKFNSTAGQTLSGVITGAGALVKDSTGTLILTGANDCTGGTTINAGVLQVGDGGATGAVGSGAIVDNGTLTYLYNSSKTLSLPSGSNISGTGILNATAGVIQFNGDLALGGSQSYTQTGGGTLFTGLELVAASTTLTGSSITLSGDVGKRNSDGNSLALDTSAANGTINLNISLGRSGVWYIPTGFTANAGTGTINVTGSGPGSSGWRSTPVTLTGAVNITGNVSSGAAVTVDSNGTTTGVVSGVLSGGMTLTKGGSGKLTLSNVNTFTGALTVNAGTLEAAAATSGNASAIGGGANTINVNSGGALLFSTNNRTAGYHTGAVNIHGGTITFNTTDNSLAVGNTVTLDTAAGTIDGSGMWRFRGGATVHVTAAATGSAISVGTVDMYDGTETFNIDSGATLTVSSTLTNGNGGVLAKTGEGALNLSGANTYSGTTTVNGGTLSVTGSLSGTGAVTVAAAATLAGTGTVGGATTVNGTLSPGTTTPGTLTVNNSLTLNATATLASKWSNPTLASVSVTGALTLDGTLTVAGLTTMPAGSHTLITYGGGLTDNGLAVTDPGDGRLYGIDTTTTPGQVLLTIAETSAYGQWWRDVYGIAPAPPEDGDYDGDGVPNGAEFAAKTNPTDNTSYLHLTNVAPAGNDLTISVFTGGANYDLERTGDLLGTWTDIGDITGNDSIQDVTDTGAATGAQWFYRAKVK